MVDIEKTKANLKKKYGDKLDSKIKEMIKKEGCSERVAIFKLGNESDNVEVEATTFVGVSERLSIRELKNTMLDEVQELVDAKISDKDIDAEMKSRKGKWRSIIAVCLGIFGKETSYVTKGVTEYQQKVGFIDPTGYLEGTIWKTANIEKLKPLLIPGKVFEVDSIVPTYYHPHKKVAVNLNVRTSITEVDDKVHSGWVTQIDDIEEYGTGLIEISDIMKPAIHIANGCGNTKCPEAYKNTKLEQCKQCGKDNGELITRTYGAVCGDDVYDFKIAPWSNVEMKEDTKYIAVRRSDYNGERQFSVAAVIDDVADAPGKDDFHQIGDSDPTSEVAPANVTPKIDTTNVEVSKKDLARIKQMITAMTSVQETQLIGVSKTMGMTPEVLAKGLDTLSETKKEGSTWTLTGS